MNNTSIIICFIAHPDDEINGAGLMHKNYLEGGKNLIVSFTGNPIRNAELENSASIIGAEVINLGFEEHKINSSLELIQNLREIILKLRPDIAILQANDYHPDHRAVFTICMDALEFISHGKEGRGFMVKKILEMETSGLIQYPDLIVDITNELKIKIKAFRAHKSQIKGKSFGNYYLEYMNKKAQLRGCQIGVKYGEAYREHNLQIKGNFYPASRGTFKVSDITK